MKYPQALTRGLPSAESRLLLIFRSCITLLSMLVFLGCLQEEREQSSQIVVRASSGGLLSFLIPYRTYILNIDRSREGARSLPADLGDHPAWSPNGKWIAFDTLLIEFNNRAHGDSNIYLMRADGGPRIQITADQGNETRPTWSPDGKKIAYSSEQGLRIINVECYLQGETCNPRPIFVNNGGLADWSPDGVRVAYTFLDPNTRNSVNALINTDGTSEPLVVTPTNKSCSDPKWSPDRAQLVMSCDGDIYLLEMTKLQLKAITFGRDLDSAPSWSPDGKKIAFISTREGLGQPLNPEGSAATNAVFIMNTDGSDIRRLGKRSDELVYWYAWLPLSSER